MEYVCNKVKALLGQQKVRYEQTLLTGVRRYSSQEIDAKKRKETTALSGGKVKLDLPSGWSRNKG